MKIVQVPFKDYYHEESPKSQIYLHHTAGTGIGDNVYKWWGSINHGWPLALSLIVTEQLSKALAPNIGLII
jgi:hypothetical protein